MKNFSNEPFTNFALAENAAAIKSALAQVRQELGKKYPLYIGGETIYTDEVIISTNPADENEVIGNVSKANLELADKAIDTAFQTFNNWSKVEPGERAMYLFKAAELMRQRKHYFSAWLVLEAGKNWAEADADTAEAIDFMNYYANEMLRYANPPQLVTVNGEYNKMKYIPLGVGVVIPPWNFPLAIMAGMTVASVVTGNTVVLKPASATPVIAAKFMELLREVGLPDGVVNYLPGSGGAIGDYLVSHKLTRFINFTGSKEVGLRISELAAKVSPGQKWIKRVAAEMGGKDSIIVDETADLDKAAQGIVASAFGFQGQKCSACSRAIVVERVYDEVIEKVLTLMPKLTQGSPEENFPMGPVIEKRAMEKILEYIEIGKQEASLILGGERLGEKGWFVKPTIFKDVPPTARISLEEIFGPVLAFIKVKDFDEALQVVNNTEYGLTGSLYTRNRENIRRAKEEFNVGNLYFNRKCTGALVGVHPFGGFNMSGTCSKAGGIDYLGLFMQMKITSEVLG
ncbi:delta-1-pyrroline-5-carboxylate dehydrogenase [Desulforamulus reducens MI-1]|uniref:L-glutamate gamma-semialdehyde dehydrogenase n=1 Tax=Desulforamulus reducens (strain ATCC BAA-1160 / DSM 100696 / MI-1) TaxID=349161 RepID=A4J5A3_DESRM|nr:L-glutamate gamma-semialdehyde dehydrogenase [Desulforamulus reducens]ABO50256.1 delta-1-pyrroline-5-carboxylate dehydrogenase [Desulforamulus reducens MI-1]